MITASIFMIILAFVPLAWLTCKALGSNTKNNPILVFISLLITSAAVRLACAFIYKGYGFDMSCFNSWSSRLYKDGFAAFYTSGQFNDYPPLYMYILRILAPLKTGLSDWSTYVILKLPAMIADIATGVFIYCAAKNKLSQKSAIILSAMYLFNPMIITNSALWGQVDSIYSLFIALMVYMIAERKLIPAYFLFALCILLKPQSFIFTPIVIIGIVKQVFIDGFDKKTFFKNLIGGLLAIGMIFLLSVPFGIQAVFEQYKATLSSSIYYSQNAFNLWGALGKNYVHVSSFMDKFEYVILAIIVAFALYTFFASKSQSGYFMAGIVLVLMTFTFSPKMHERYGFAATILLIMAYIYKPNKYSLIAYISVSAAMFFNIAWVLKMNTVNINEYYWCKFIVVISTLSTIVYIVSAALLFYGNFSKKDTGISDMKH